MVIGIYLGNTFDGASDGQDTIVDTLDNLGDTSLDAGLIAEISNVLTGLANDDTSLLGRDEGTERQGSCSIVLLALLVLMIVLVVVLEQ